MIKMPGSLSNEDEGQDDMDFEDDMPGEVKGEAGCPSHYFCAAKPCMWGEKGLSCVPETTEEGCGVIRRVIFYHLFLFLHDLTC